MKLKCILIDDEPMALKLMEDFASRIPFLDVVGRFNNPVEAIEFVSKNSTEIVFLDINMPDISGIELALKFSDHTHFVFCTAYAEHAVAGFELQATDYLLKPYSFERFLKAACKAQEQVILRKSYHDDRVLKEEPGYIFIRSEYSLIKVNTHEIVLLEGLKDYVKVFLSGKEKPVLTLQSLRSFEDKLPARDFFRVHKSYIVNVNRVETVQRNFVTVQGREIPVGNQYRELFQEMINKHLPGK